MKKYQLFWGLPILCLTAFCWSNCSVCTISVQNDTIKKIDSIRINIQSENKHTVLIKNIPSKQSITKTLTSRELKLGHYFFISSIIYSKDSTYSGPYSSTDMVFGGEKYTFVISDGKTTLKVDK